MAYWNSQTKAKLSIGVCCNQDKTDKELTWNLMEMEKPDNFAVIHKGEHNKSSSLNAVVAQAAELNSTHVLLLDADMEFPINTITKLLSHQVPIVGGLYHIKPHPYSPVAGWNKMNTKSHSGSFHPDRINGRGRIWKTDYYPLPENKLVQVQWTGVGCLLIDMDVFSKVPYPAFWDDWNRKTGTRLRGHDLIFSDNVLEAGFPIYIDTSVQCGHRDVITVDRAFIDAYYASGMDKIYKDIILAHTDDRDSIIARKRVYNTHLETDEFYEAESDFQQTQQYWNLRWRHGATKGVFSNRLYLLKYLLPYLDKSNSIVDLGCGDGALIHPLALRGYPIHGFDFSSECIENLRSQGIDGDVVDFKTFIPTEALYHTAIMSHILEHMDGEYEERLIRVAMGIACDTVIIIVPEELDSEKLIVEHHNAYDKESLTKLLLKYFRDIDVIEIPTDDDGRAWKKGDLMAVGKNFIFPEEGKLEDWIDGK